MGIAVIGLIVLAIVALLAIPVIVAVVGRSATDEDPNRTGDPEDDRDVTIRDDVETSEEEEGSPNESSERSGRG